MSQPTQPGGEIQTGTGGAHAADHRPNTKMINGTGDRLSLAVLGLMFLGGLWLMAAPVLVDYQTRSTHWAAGTVSIFSVGGAVTAIAVVMGIVLVGGHLFDLSRSNRPPRHGEQETSDDPS